MLVFYVREPSSLVFRVLLSVVVIIGLLEVGVVLRSFQKFFGERREVGKRLIAEVRIHRAETKLLRSEIQEAADTLSETLSNTVREVKREIKATPLADQKKVQQVISTPLLAHGKEISYLRSEINDSSEALSAIRAQIGRQVEEVIEKSPPPDWEKIQEFLAQSIKDTIRHVSGGFQPIQNSSQDSEFKGSLVTLEEEMHAIACMLKTIQTTQEGILPQIAEHYSVRAKQLVSIVDAQRQELTNIRVRAEQLLHSREI